MHCVYADRGYNRRGVVDVLFQSNTLTITKQAVNNGTGAVSVTGEWCYRKVKLHWTVVDFNRKMKTKEGHVGLS